MESQQWPAPGDHHADGTVGGVFALIVSILATPLGAHAQQQKLHRIGWLITVPSSSAPTLQGVAAFRQALGDLGHVEGQNLIVEYRFAEGDSSSYPPWRPSWPASRWTSLLLTARMRPAPHNRPPG